MSEMVGGSFTGATSRLKLVEAVARPSLTVSVITALPDWLAAGTTVTVRLPPDPPNMMLAFGTSVGLDDEPLTTRASGGVSVSLTLKAIGPIGVSSLVA